jgi:hypothetical protein
VSQPIHPSYTGGTYHPAGDVSTGTAPVYSNFLGTGGSEATKNDAAGFNPYGGYAGGFQDTGNWLAGQQANAQHGQPPPNFNAALPPGQVAGYLGQASQGDNNGANLAMYGQQISQLQGIANGATTPADLALQRGSAAGASAQMAAAQAGPTGVTQSAMKRGAGGNISYAQGQDANAMGQQKYNEEVAAQGALTGALQGQQAQYAGMRGTQLSAAQLEAQNAQWNAGMNQQNQFNNSNAGYGWANQIMGMNAQEQAAQMQGMENYLNYQTGDEQINQGMALNNANTAIGGIAGATSGWAQMQQQNNTPQPQAPVAPPTGYSGGQYNPSNPGY